MKKTLLLAFAFFSINTTANAQWTDGQNAEYVVGQQLFTNDTSATTAQNLSNPRACAVDTANGKLYVADSANNRILRFNYPITGSFPTADLVFGQSTFTTQIANNGGRSSSSLYFPSCVAIDSNGSLYVIDSANSRVLIFNNASSLVSNKPNADKVIGQSGFTTNATATSTTGLNNPNGLHVDSNGTLWVCDTGNNRVLRYDNISSKSSGAAADGVLGQSGFTGSASGRTASTFNYPSNLTTIGQSLFVADHGNSRVLRFDLAAGKTNGADADAVLGQPGFTSYLTSNTQTTFGGRAPSITSDGNGTLYVGLRSRVFIFDDATSLGNGAPADHVLGQTVFTDDSARCTQSGLSSEVRGLSVDQTNSCLLAADSNNNRVIIQSASSSLPVQLDYLMVE